jgi:hypothetical protein
MSTCPRKPMYEWQIKQKRKRYVAEGRCIDCGQSSKTFRCDECNKKRNEYIKGWKLRNPERFRAINKKYRDAHPDRVREKAKRAMANSYDMTVEEYDIAVKAPCGICGTTEKRRGIDHCHRTNKVRGTLCIRCNSSLGWFENNKENIVKWYENGGGW